MSQTEDTAPGPLRESVKKICLSKKYDIPIERLSYEHIGECKDAREIEQIVKILRSGEEGTFPQLIEFAENKLRELNPKCKLLRKEEPALLPSCLDRDEWADVKSDLMNWTEEVRAMDVNLAQETSCESEIDIFTMDDPPIRNVAEITTNKPVKKPMIEDISKPAKKIVPRSYADWDKFDADEELLRLDTEDERKKEKLEVKKKLDEEKEALKRTKERQNREKELRQNREKERQNREEKKNREKENQKRENEKQNKEKEKQNRPKEKVEDREIPIATADPKPSNREMTMKITLAALERMKGNEFFKEGDFETAATHFLRSTNVHPTAKAYTNLAQALYKLSNFEDAIVACDNALELEPDNVKAWFRRGASHFRLQLHKLAIADLRRVIELEPNNKMAAKLLANATGWDEVVNTTPARRMQIMDLEHIPEEPSESEKKAEWNSQLKAERDYFDFISEDGLKFDEKDFPELRTAAKKTETGRPKIEELSSTEFEKPEKVVNLAELLRSQRRKNLELAKERENGKANDNRAEKSSRPKIVEISSVDFAEEQGNSSDNSAYKSRPKIVEIDSTDSLAGNVTLNTERACLGSEGEAVSKTGPDDKFNKTSAHIEEVGQNDRQKLDRSDGDRAECRADSREVKQAGCDGKGDGGSEIIGGGTGEEATEFSDADCKKDYVDSAKLKGDAELSFAKKWKAIVDDPDMSKHARFLMQFNPEDLPKLVAGELDLVVLAGLLFCLDMQAALFAIRRIDYVCGVVACERFREVRGLLTKDVDDVFVRLVESIVVDHSGMPLEEFEASQKAAGEQVKWRYPSDHCDWEKNEALKEQWGQHPTIAPLLSRMSTQPSLVRPA